MDDQMVALAPISALPTELLLEIFMGCLPEHPEPSRKVAPLLLCRVCSKWRAIALAQPQLWTSLFLGRRQHSLKLIGTWMARSGT